MVASARYHPLLKYEEIIGNLYLTEIYLEFYYTIELSSLFLKFIMKLFSNQNYREK